MSCREKEDMDIDDFGDGVFGYEDGSVICWRGQNYVPQRMTLRVHLHNFIIKLRNRRFDRKQKLREN